MADDFQIVRDHLRVGADFLGDGLVALDRIEAKLRAAEEYYDAAEAVLSGFHLKWYEPTGLGPDIRRLYRARAALSQKETTPSE